jgi:hypothetical protein
MTSLGVRNQLRIASQTGVAAGNVGGSTLHSLLRLPFNDKDKEGALPDTVINNFQNVTLFFIDEISMTGCVTLNCVSNRLKDAKSNAGEPFGGVDMIFAGDFYQLPPMNGGPLYRKLNLSADDSTINTTKAGLGFILFSCCTHVIFLTQQHRMTDPVYRAFVARYREGRATPRDQAYCKELVIDASNPLSSGHLSDLEDDPVVIVQHNDLRYHINNTKARQHASALGEKLLINVARDKSKSHVTSIVRRSFLLWQDCGATSYLAGLLPLFRGMRVMIKKNYATELGVANGSIGVIHNIVVDTRESIDYDSNEPHFLSYHPKSVYVRVITPLDRATNEPEVKFQLSGLPPNVFMMTRDANKVGRPLNVRLTGNQLQIPHDVVMQREQYRFLPAYCITVNSSQGRTLESAVICLDGGYTVNAKPYVMLSRLTNGRALGIIGKVPIGIWKVKPNADMLHFMEEVLDVKARDTLAALDHSQLQASENLLRTV